MDVMHLYINLENISKKIEYESSTSSNEEKKRDHLNDCIRLMGDFNDTNESTFAFNSSNIPSDVHTKLANQLKFLLSSSWSSLVKLVSANYQSDISMEILFGLNSNLLVSILNAIRLMSRDQSIISMFEDDTLLGLVQRIANLTIVNEQDAAALLSSSSELDVITLSALKSISNLIYNSKFIQEFYIRNGMAETITISLKQFNPVDSFNTNALKTNKINIMLFNLRILFLLTALNKDLRNKLREKLQVITYLIEIMDQIMKERLSEDTSQLNSELASISNSNQFIVDDTTSGGNDQFTQNDFCYLKSIDIDFVNEILKILYNLTIDITSSNNANSGQSNNTFTIRTAHNEEDEAHLMHLVSVLRDLVTCRLEEEYDLVKSTNKLKMLHSNIVNLLTNMPNLCYEELMTPCIFANNGNSPNSSPSNKLFKQINNYNFRMAHNKKRLSRRSKRIKKKQLDSSGKRESKTREITANISAASSATSSAAITPTNSTEEYNSLMLITTEEDLEFEGKNMEALIIILEYLNHHLSNYINNPTAQSSDLLYPILLLLSLMTKSNRTIRHYYKLKVLPPLKKIDLVHLPESGLQLRNKLVKLMTDPNIQIKRLSAQFLFILCKENVGRLIKYTGYGNAAGLMADVGLLLGGHMSDRGSYSSDSEDSDTEDYKRLEDTINTVTGRAELDVDRSSGEKSYYYDKKTNKYYKLKKDVFGDMTEEQKEHEALQLVSAIDKLAKLGGLIRPATIGVDGKPVEIQHVLQLQEGSLLSNESMKQVKESKKSEDENNE